MNLDYMWIFSI